MEEKNTVKHETVENSQEIHRQRKGRNWAFLGLLMGLIALIYTVTIVKMGLK